MLRLVLHLSLALLSCTGWGGDDTAEPCTDDCLADLSLVLSEDVPMGVRASWLSAAEGRCAVAFRETDGAWQSTPTRRCSPGGRQSAVLRGLHADAHVEVEVAMTVNGVTQIPLTGETTTAPLPEGVPQFTVEVPWTGDDDGGFIQGSFSQEQAGVFVLDRDGRYVYLWMNEVEQDRDVFNARLMPDLTVFWLVLNHERVAREWGLLVERDWFGAVRRLVEVPWVHHDLLPLDDGSVLVIEAVPDDLEEEFPIWGDRVLRVHPDDTQTELWSSWDDLEPPERAEGTTGWYAEGQDWLHANSLALHPDGQTVLMGSGDTHTLFELALDGSGLVRTYGSELADSWPVDGEPFEHPHGAHWTPDGDLVLLSSDWEAEETTAVRYTVDTEGQLLRPAWSRTDPEAFAQIGGSATLRGDQGNVLVDYGSDLVIQEVDADGQELWRVRAEGTAVIFQAWPLPELWPPDEEDIATQ